MSTSTPNWTSGMITDPGRHPRKRLVNEDTVGSFVPPAEALLALRGALYVVADGMGGHNAGEVASEIALNTVIEAYYAAPAVLDDASCLTQAILLANERIYQRSQQESATQGMGTTIVACVLHTDGRLLVANVGDSSVYLIRDGAATKLSVDHSWVAEQVAAGVLTPEQAKTHEKRHAITRSLGRRLQVEVECSSHTLREDDVLVLCSDGLSDVVEDGEIVPLAWQGAVQEAAEGLCALANARGGPDNISVVVIRYAPTGRLAVAPAPAASGALPARPSAAPQPRGRRRRAPVAALIIAAVVVLGAGATAGWYLTRPKPDFPPSSTTATPTVSLASPTSASALTPASLSETIPTPAQTNAPTATAPTATSATAEGATRRPSSTLAATSTIAATHTPRPTATTAGYAEAPRLTAPGCDGEWLPKNEVTLQWQFAPGLKADEKYRVQVWLNGSQNKLTFIATANSYTYTVPSDGDYRWMVEVVRARANGSWELVSPAAQACLFRYKKVEPTSKPKPKS